MGDENINEIVKPELVLFLENFNLIKISDEFNFKNTLMYRHLIYDNQIDMLSLGKEFIGIIKDELLKFQKIIKLDNYLNMLELKKMFTIESVTNGIFSIYQELLGLKFINITDANPQALYSIDVKLFAVFNENDDNFVRITSSVTP